MGGGFDFELPEVRTQEIEAGTMIGEYKVTSILGQGGMGIVYGAEHPVIGKKAAIKVLTYRSGEADVVARFVQEARAVNAIKHPNIVDVFSFGTLDDGRAFFIMEQLEGQPLGKLTRGRRLSVDVAAMLFEQICKAVAAAHRKGIVHRDLKPENIFLVDGEDGPVVKVLDFGIAKLQRPDDTKASGNLTSTGVLLGTPAYMSPEQARSEGISPATDVYALGVMLFEVLTGRQPFTAPNSMDLVIKHVQEPAPDPRIFFPVLPAAMAQMIMRMMAKEPDNRPSLDEVRELLRGYSAQQRPTTNDGQSYDSSLILRTLEPMPLPPLAVAAAPALAAPRHRSRIALVVAAVGVCLGIAAAVIASRGGEEQTDKTAQAAEQQTAEPTVAAAGPAANETDANQAGDPAPAETETETPAAAPPPPGPAAGGVLTVRLPVPGATVKVDGQEVEASDGLAIIEFEENGQHRVSVRAPEHHSYETVVGISGAPVTVEPKLAPIVKPKIKAKPARARKRRGKRTEKKLPKRKGRLIVDPF